MAKVSCTFCNKHVTVCPYRAVACLMVKKRSVFCGLIAIQEFFSLKMWCLIVFFIEIACKHVKRYFGYWMERSSVFTLLPPRFSLSFSFLLSKQQVIFISIDQLLSILAFLCFLQTVSAALQREWFMPLNEWVKSHIFHVFRFDRLKPVTAEYAAFFQPSFILITAIATMIIVIIL